ncbi:beta-1,3-galactosyl-O-glycosyl-glycoprotein beta-1,6-N-acetylglucosaminyltransferase-like [Liolophura sinensis]|uniref:beta-1,3-galactosyl-O-glycosyl-glycoprotein beta-1,6-N-acetylglucosaminyltransferase-like n=1 Tax=Liolophura sinensis TaxID=3198878 RepID=UPI0031586292
MWMLKPPSDIGPRGLVHLQSTSPTYYWAHALLVRFYIICEVKVQLCNQHRILLLEVKVQLCNQHRILLLEVKVQLCNQHRILLLEVKVQLCNQHRILLLEVKVQLSKPAATVDIEQAERLLRAIYQPQNYYCIHVDRKSEDSIKNGMKAVAKCFDNVFLVEKPVAVVWGKFTVLEAELLCLKELWAYQKWKYFINLTGQEFPLKINFELVKILKAYNGSNNLEGTRGRANTDRWKNAGPPPHGIIPTKGAVHITASRGYVDFLLHNQTALDFLEWVKKTRVPDETFFASLNHNPFLEVPGSYKGTPESNFENYHFLTRFKIWAGTKLWKLCTGKFTRAICIFGVKDLPVLTSQRHLFANKFHWDYQPYVLDCLEEWHFNKTIDQAVHKSNFDVSFYKNMSFVKNKVT